MLRQISAGMTAGIAKIKWFFSIVAERIKIEIAVVRLLGRSEKYESERKELLVDIGERVIELKSGKQMNVYQDDLIKESLKKLDALEEEISQLRKEAEEISALEI
jgi:hypothetical protein